jgi:hypothetical protein
VTIGPCAASIIAKPIMAPFPSCALKLGVDIASDFGDRGIPKLAARFEQWAQVDAVSAFQFNAELYEILAVDLQSLPDRVAGVRFAGGVYLGPR